MSHKRVNLDDMMLMISCDQRVIIVVGDQETCKDGDYKIVADDLQSKILPSDVYHQYKLNRVICVEAVPKKGLKIYVQENYETPADVRIIESWKDVITVPEETKRIASTYSEQGYDVDLLFSNSFRIKLDDGVVNVYWQDGAFWEETRKEEQ